jgi:hydrogenase maturation protein HypF
MTTAVGRLFDAAASLTGLLHRASYEGQGPMYLEAACDGVGRVVPLPLASTEGGLWRTDWQPLIPALLDERLPVSERASMFHESLAHAVVAQARQARSSLPVSRVGLTGGVFQNRVLTERAVALLEAEQFRVHLPERVPGNDGGISFGQVMEANASASSRPGSH